MTEWQEQALILFLNKCEASMCWPEQGSAPKEARSCNLSSDTREPLASDWDKSDCILIAACISCISSPREGASQWESISGQESRLRLDQDKRANASYLQPASVSEGPAEQLHAVYSHALRVPKMFLHHFWPCLSLPPATAPTVLCFKTAHQSYTNEGVAPEASLWLQQSVTRAEQRYPQGGSPSSRSTCFRCAVKKLQGRSRRAACQSDCQKTLRQHSHILQKAQGPVAGDL
eukprot:260004-Pelagomonas_calceolata.AAC.1